MSSVLVTGWERGLKAGVGALEAISMGDSCLRQGLYATSPDAARKMVSLLLLLLCPHPKCYRVSIAERNSDTRSRDMLGCWAGTGSEVSPLQDTFDVLGLVHWINGR
ncbi:hypothetical protein BT69DRAFT_1286616 [Atractiella rhizophila]|nr:hypothetical protein BT69DRAFT_1286616 [Atractiella rhizophila]